MLGHVALSRCLLILVHGVENGFSLEACGLKGCACNVLLGSELGETDDQAGSTVIPTESRADRQDLANSVDGYDQATY